MLVTEHGASNTRPWLPRVSPMATSSPSRQHRQHRLLQALRQSRAHFCRREGRGRAGTQGCPLSRMDPKEGLWGMEGVQPPGAGGAYKGSTAEVTGQQQGRDSTGDGLRGGTGRSARSSICPRDTGALSLLALSLEAHPGGSASTLTA